MKKSMKNLMPEGLLRRKKKSKDTQAPASTGGAFGGRSGKKEGSPEKKVPDGGGGGQSANNPVASLLASLKPLLLHLSIKVTEAWPHILLLLKKAEQLWEKVEPYHPEVRF